MAKEMCVDKWQRWLEECATRPEYFGESLRRLRSVHCHATQEDFSKLMYLESRVPVIRMEKAKEVSDITTDTLVRLRILIEDLPESGIIRNVQNETFVELIRQIWDKVFEELEARRERLSEKKQSERNNENETQQASSKLCSSKLRGEDKQKGGSCRQRGKSVCLVSTAAGRRKSRNGGEHKQ